MANSDDVALRGEILTAHAEAVRMRARTLLAQYRGLAEAIAATEERVAATMDRVAAGQPEHARRCRARSQQAREQAALWRRRARQLAKAKTRLGYAPAFHDHETTRHRTSAPRHE